MQLSVRGLLRPLLLTAAFVISYSLLIVTSVMAQAQPVDFESFEFDRRRIEDSDRPFRDRLELRGTFTLGERTIDPLTEEVQVTIEGVDECIVFTQTISPGSFEVEGRRVGRREFEFEGDGVGELEEIEIQERGE